MSDYKALLAKIRKLEKDHGKRIQECSEKIAKCDSLYIQYQELREEYSKLSKNLDEAKKQNMRLRKERDEAKQRSEKCDKAYVDLRDHYEMLKSKFEANREEIRERNKEMIQLLNQGINNMNVSPKKRKKIKFKKEDED